MSEWTVVTGGSRGLGLALVHRFSHDFPNMQILSLGRTRPETTATNIHHLAVDLTTQEGRTAVSTFLGSQPVRFLVHNAGANSYADLHHITSEKYKSVMTLNVEVPLFLTQQLASNLVPGARVILVGSKAGEKYTSGSLSYCISKAGLMMLKQVFLEDLKTVDTAVMCPGAVDTDMFRAWHQQTEGTIPVDLTKVLQPEVVAHFFVYLLRDVGAEDFRNHFWHVYDQQHHQFWLPEGSPIPESPFLAY